MGIVVNSLSSFDLLFSDALYKAAFVIALLRWALYWALKLRTHLTSHSSELSTSSCANTTSSTQLIKDNLFRTTFEGSDTCRCDACAVCLNELEIGEEVRELRNCCHVFHTECIDRWLDYNGCDDHRQHDEDNHKTCPLCRTPMLTSAQVEGLSWDHQRTAAQPSWAVERLLYLFGDDLVL